MGLINNYSDVNKSAYRFRGATTTAGAAQANTRVNFDKPADWRNFGLQDRSGGTGSVVTLAAKPNGYYPPAAWKLPTTAGALSSYQGLTGAASMSGSGALGLNGVAPLTGSGDISSAALALIVSAVAALTGSGTITADIVGAGNAIAALTGSGDLTSADLKALANLVAGLIGTGSVSADVTAKGSASADITVSGDLLTTANVGDSIWGALAASFNSAGTMGAIMNSIGSGTDPWATSLPGSYSGDQAGALLYIMNQILRNKQKTDPATGIMTVYADDGTTVLFTANVFNDANGTEPYDGTVGVNLKDRLE